MTLPTPLSARAVASSTPPPEERRPVFFCTSCGAHHRHWSLVAQLRKSIELVRQSRRDKEADGKAQNNGVDANREGS